MKSPVIIGAKNIMEYLNLTRAAFNTLKKIGLPVKLLNGRYYAHKDNLDDFFKEATKSDVKV